jgi:Tfp pilus assembly protein PilN
MIKVNLLGPPDHSRRNTRTLLKFGAWIAGGCILAGIATRLWISSQLTLWEAQRDATARELAVVRAAAAKARAGEAQIGSLREQAATMEALERSRRAAVPILTAIASAIPERAWLTELFERDGVLHIRGLAVDGETIAAFKKSLSGSEHIQQVAVDQAKQTEVQGEKLQEFAVTARVRFPKPALKPQAPSVPAKTSGAGSAKGAVSRVGS